MFDDSFSEESNSTNVFIVSKTLERTLLNESSIVKEAIETCDEGQRDQVAAVDKGIRRMLP